MVAARQVIPTIQYYRQLASIDRDSPHRAMDIGLRQPYSGGINNRSPLNQTQLPLEEIDGLQANVSLTLDDLRNPHQVVACCFDRLMDDI